MSRLQHRRNATAAKRASPQALAFHCAKSWASRSAVSPARSLAWRSAGWVLNQSSVSLAVVGSGRKVRPAAIALRMLVLEKPAVSPCPGTQTGMSDQAETLLASRKLSGTQTSFAVELNATATPESI